MPDRTAGSSATTTERALCAIRDLRARVDLLERRQSEPVAIVGMGCRFPGAADLAAFWDLLVRGEDPLGPVPQDRWNIDSLYNPDPQARGKTVSREGGYLPNLDRFDADFFGITPREAPFIDPRQRLVLETAWEALEDAGIPADRLAGSLTSVVVGTLTNDYNQLITADDRWVSAATGTGTSNSIIANRLSYVLDLHGPSLTVDTACSGSLLALHLACQTLRTGEATAALCGGVAVNLVPAPDICFSRMGALSPRGRCHTFDAASDGMARSEGAGMVVLKLLSQAEADGDRIYALIRASAVNHDGRSNGIAAPNGQAQERLLREAYGKAGIAPGRVQYVEAHGTGTIVGDRIELQALAQVLGTDRAPGHGCVVGSVKSNIGHTESAAGIAGIIKTALALKHRLLPGNLHFETPHPALSEAPFALEVRTAAGLFPAPEEPIVAGVSAFSFGGANVHVVLEEAPPAIAPPAVSASAEAATAYVLPLSAKSPDALTALARAYVAFLRAPDAPGLADICATAALRRTPHAFRLAVAGTSREEMAARLEAHLAGEDVRHVATGAALDGEAGMPLAFVFSGQGSHWLGMGRDLYATAPAFRAVIDRLDALVRAEAGWSLIEELNAAPDASRLDDIDVVQPAIFAMQAGLVALWRELGVVPDVVLGQSMGEIPAAFAAGILSLEDAARVILARSRLLRTKRGVGATAVVGLPAAEVEAALAPQADRLAVAGVTSFASTLIAGDGDALRAYLAELEAAGIFARLLENVDVPAHSPAMDSLSPALESALAAIAPRPAQLRFLSTVTVSDEPGPNLDAAYWSRNLRDPFRVADAVAKLSRERAHLFLEISPHPVLVGALRQILPHVGADGVALGTLTRDGDGALDLATALGNLWANGFAVDWRRVLPAGRCVSLPAYPWQRAHFWVDQIAATTGGSAGARKAGSHPLLGAPFAAAQGGAHFWDGEIDISSLPWLRDHALSGVPVLPGAAYLEMALAAAREAMPGQGLVLEDARFEKMLLLPEGEARRLQVTLTRTGGDGAQVAVLSRPLQGEDDWTLHARIGVRKSASEAPAGPAPAMDEGAAAVDLASFYGQFAAGGLDYGPAFRGVRALHADATQAWAEVALPEGLSDTAFGLHPALLDGAFQVVAAIGTDGAGARPVYLPQGVGTLAQLAAVPARVFVHARLAADAVPGAPRLAADLTLSDADGTVVARVTGLALRRVDEMRPRASASLRDSLYHLEWHERPRAPRPAPGNAAGLWLLSGAPGAVADSLAAALRERGGEVHLLAPGADLAAGIAAAGATLRGVVLLEAGAGATDVPDAVFEAVALRALPAVKALAEGAARARLFIVTRGAVASDGADPAPDLVAAPLWGFGRVVGMEHAEIWGAQIDLDAEGSCAAAADEMLDLNDDREIALRAGRRLVGRLARLPKPAVAAGPVLLRPDASYLVTGGLTGLGLETARFLVARGARRLILIGRTPLPPRADWAELPLESEAGQRVAAVLGLEALGASVRVEAFDVADETRLAAFLAAYGAEAHPPIRGVVHAAGVIRDALLLRMTGEDIAAVLRPKVAGALALHRQTANLPLDHFVLFSSASSVLGQVGQAGYGAANAFEDALAWHRRAAGLPATAINWGPWADIGLFARLGLAERAGLSGVEPIAPEEGMAALDHLMARGETQALVLNADWAQVPASARLELLQAAAASDTSSTAGEIADLLLMAPAERRTELRARLGGIVAAVLRFDAEKLDHRRALTTLGMDSIMAVEIRNRIKRQFDLTPSIVDLFTGSVARLADWLDGELAADDRLKALLDEIEDLPEAEVEALLASGQKVA
ncbi:type I polyketide synthase [Xanthobacter autotrophicus]|uniref:type I polyketide synthase n=1 Tax=Xanthobacter autotrophicus TaxID=280 RepID=UPI0024A64DA5|nr:type I polyketide synthase [Xanthobacter autotrophicus]MDI4656772.1 type I polyketide synthase [Xanthobacter autotrophicus]